MNNVALLILDGWGMAPSWGGNAISQANTPNFNKLWRDNPHTILGASGEDVGLSGHEAGNSEVGHLNIGAGRIVYQDISRISQSIKDGSFFTNSVLVDAVKHANKNQSKMHFMGLVSDGGVHAHIEHLFALLDFAKKQGLKEVYIHAFCDGRDSEPQSALQFISKLNKKIKDVGLGEIATICGRYYTMDRDHHWERIRPAYDALVLGKGQVAKSALSAISSSYAQGVSDEFIRPTIIIKNNQPIAKISDNDSVIFFNFRADRAREITRPFVDKNFNKFPVKQITNLFFCGFIPCGVEDDGNIKPVFVPQNIKNSLAEIISSHNFRQFHIAETEKYAHVTYFFNGGKEQLFRGEDRQLIPSPRVNTYDLSPEMSAEKITEVLINKIESKVYSFVVGNFANADMVGHSGNFKATITACEKIDKCLGKVINAIIKSQGILLITADHGNADEILNAKTGQMNTEHSKNPVPFILINKSLNNKSYTLVPKGILADIAPTILEILAITKPPEMTGKSLINGLK